MDVQKQDDLIKEAFEIEAEEIGFCLDQLWGDYENPYENSDTALAFNLFKKGWLAKAQAVPKWISVKDKLPSDDIGRVLAWVVEQNSLGKCGFVWNCSHSNGVFSDKFETFQVTHWMPLPDAPQEPTND